MILRKGFHHRVTESTEPILKSVTLCPLCLCGERRLFVAVLLSAQMHYTFLTTIRDCVYVKQIAAGDVVTALREAIAMLPYDDGSGPFDDELEWLLRVTEGEAEVTMFPIAGCKNTWLWLQGSRHEPQYLTYAIQTDVS